MSDYGYAVTSHSSQGTTAARVLVHVDTEQAHEQLINSRLAYVSVSRGRYDARIFANDAGKLGEELGRDACKQSRWKLSVKSTAALAVTRPKARSISQRASRKYTDKTM
jgi:ATP-dependent exoDNAse (exonuclease V) alpha subunit